MRNCSWTTVKRSSRASPRRTSSAFGTVTSGLAFHTIIAVTGGSRPGSVRSSPSRLMFSWRGMRPASRSGRLSATSSIERVVVRPDAAGEAAAAVLPRPDEGRQHGQRAEEHRPVLVVLGADQRADRGRADRAVVGGQALDDAGVEPADRGCPLGRPVGDVGDQLLVAERVGIDPGRSTRPSRTSTWIIASIRAMSVPGQRLDELVCRLGGDRADRVDHDDLGAVRPGRLDGRPQVAVGQPGVRAPQQDQPAVAQLEGVEAEAAAVRHAHPVADRRAAHRPQQPAGAEVVEEPAVEAHHRQQALVAGVAERQDRLGAVVGDGVVQARRRSRPARRPR